MLGGHQTTGDKPDDNHVDQQIHNRLIGDRHNDGSYSDTLIRVWWHCPLPCSSFLDARHKPPLLPCLPIDVIVLLRQLCLGAATSLIEAQFLQVLRGHQIPLHSALQIPLAVLPAGFCYLGIHLQAGQISVLQGFAFSKVIQRKHPFLGGLWLNAPCTTERSPSTHSENSSTSRAGNKPNFLWRVCRARSLGALGL